MKSFDVDKKGSEKDQAKKAQRSEGKSGKDNEPPLLGYRSMPLVELVERLTRLNLRNVSVEHRPQLAEQGKQACAERGERIAVASPEVLDDARVMAHEAAHIVQQRGGAKLEDEGASEAQAPQVVGAEHGKAELTGDAGGSATPTAPVASASEASRGEGAQPAVPEQKLGEQTKRPIDKKSTDYEAEADAAAVSFMGGPVPEGGLQLSAASQAVMYQDGPQTEPEADGAPKPAADKKPEGDGELEPGAAVAVAGEDPEPKYKDQRQPGPLACELDTQSTSGETVTFFKQSTTTVQKLDALRAQSPIPAEALAEAKLQLHETFAPGSNELWLAERIAEHGPEPLWGKDLLQQRFERLHDYQVALALDPNLEGLSLLFQVGPAFEQHGVAGVVTLLRSQTQSVSITPATQETILSYLAGDASAQWYAKMFIEHGPDGGWSEELQTEWLRLRNEQSYSENGAQAELLRGQSGGGDWAIEAYYFQGRTSERALVIAGVHGREQGAVQLCEMLIADLKQASTPPHYSVIVVPILFPQNACKCPQPNPEKQDKGHWGKCSREIPDKKRDTAPKKGLEVNRNFPEEFKTLADTPRNAAGEYLDANGDVILPENVALLKLIERFQPSRIMSMHGNSNATETGFTIDKRVPDAKSSVERDQARLERFDKDPESKAAYEEMDKADHELAVAMGQRTQQAKAVQDETRPTLTTINDKGGSEFSTNKSKAKDGVSLGRYASAAGLTIITLEVQGNDRAVEKKAGDHRTEELLAYNEAIKALFLGMTP